MGLFAKRPEEPSAWAALPGEPLDDEDEFLLPAAPSVDPLVLDADGVTSVSISVVPMPSAETGASGGESDAPDAEAGQGDTTGAAGSPASGR
ncbi:MULTISPECIES: hypothetical protein [Bacteria]|uniref:hypothetical protein n=1 Tax=Bacteria TaxID=2 RepID=UPI003C7A433C